MGLMHDLLEKHETLEQYRAKLRIDFIEDYKLESEQHSLVGQMVARASELLHKELYNDFPGLSDDETSEIRCFLLWRNV